MQQKPLTLRSWIVLVLLCVGVLWLWYSFIRFRPDDVRDYSTITGTLVSADEQIIYGKTRSGYLEIRLQENPLRYCVPADGYLDYFRREAFFTEVPKGATVELAALASNIASPRTALLNSTPTVFVRGVRAGGRDYCAVEDYIAWQRRGNWARLALAVLGSGLLALIFFRLRQRQKGRGRR